MAKEFAQYFYNSVAWKRTAKAYAASKFFPCEDCGEEGWLRLAGVFLLDMIGQKHEKLP